MSRQISGRSVARAASGTMSRQISGRRPARHGHSCRVVTGRRYAGRMARVRLFAAAREAAGTGRDVVDGGTVAEVLAAAVERYGDRFAAVLATCRVWVNGEPAGPDAPLDDTDEVALLPPVSGG